MRKINDLERTRPVPVITPKEEYRPKSLTLEPEKEDTLKVVDEYGYSVPYEMLDGALKVATFRNVAERSGKVDLRFRVTVPSDMLDTKWQICLSPILTVQEDTTVLEPFLITGSLFRKRQLRSYDRYRRYLESIITDSSAFVDGRSLGIFIDRNDSTMYEEALNHYTNNLWKDYNMQRYSGRKKVFRRMVRTPIVTEGYRIDTVFSHDGTEVHYDYTQTIRVTRSMRKAEILLDGSVSDMDRTIYGIHLKDPFVFYISSLSTLVDDTPRYLDIVISRRVESENSYHILFGMGKDYPDTSLAENAEELARISRDLISLRDDEELSTDSVRVIATCSPEGSYAVNSRLSWRRGSSICRMFKGFLPDSVKFKPETVPENWDLFREIVLDEKGLHPKHKKEILKILEDPDLDLREQRLSRLPLYSYLKERIYPRLRVVDFQISSHRRNMVKDTVHTTMVDSVYMEGVKLIREREYRKALNILAPYSDYNTAVALMSLDLNASAVAILEELKETARVLYLKAILYSRMGRYDEAVELYGRCCEMEGSFVHRGNLDPEISSLLKRYY